MTTADDTQPLEPTGADTAGPDTAAADAPAVDTPALDTPAVDTTALEPPLATPLEPPLAAPLAAPLPVAADPAAPATVPAAAAQASVATRPRTRWAAIIWGLVLAAIAGFGVWTLLESERREGLVDWLSTLSAPAAIAYVVLVVGVLTLVIGAVGVARRIQRAVSRPRT
ncbi:hypothetical protein JOD63_002150 [Microbacterium terrae]|uniref:Uncharacterized protein n=1 Tax=Microbacterium terrae TaxID=69369 RepID=A0A0M2HL78_9MICO|nr:hypothetical protein [Microbacterium terrae]KJL45143.1 hypothetical protein RS81_00325 [Microbacterium terrae]MBP1078182.1 hypothetical protein [Microbacterium terrae]GLJ97661.1 hypothetical protein GCM10017594_08580 [Microbacterium terrae]